MPSDSRDDDGQDHAFVEEVARASDDSNETPRGSRNPVDRPESSQSSARSITPAETQEPQPLPVEESSRPRARNRRQTIFGLTPQSTSVPVGVPTVDSRGYAPSQPFEEAAPMSSIWRAYLDESEICDREICEAHRGETNILLVFAGLFSAVVSTFIAQSLTNLQPNYQQLSALLVFDQINIQRAIANGTSLDTIRTSGADPTVGFTPKRLDSWVNGLWLASLTLSLSYAFLAVLADEWHSHYLSPVAGDPQVRSRTRQFRYTGLIEWRVSTLIRLLPLMLHLSLALFFVGLVLSLLPLQWQIALAIGMLSLATFMAYFVTNILSILYPQCPYKTPLSSVGYAIIMWILRYSSTVQSAMSSLTSKFPPESKTLEDFEIHDAERSRVKHDLNALRWLYVGSSTSAIRHLVIHALSGLPLEYIDEAKEIFKSQWDEIKYEKERLLMGCMMLTREGSTRWIPKDIPNIGRRIEPLLRLERLFPQLRQRDSSGIFGKHKLNFSMKSFSGPLLTTLSTYKDPPYIKVDWGQYSMNKLAITALNNNRLHHPTVWRDIYNNTFPCGLLYNYTHPSRNGPLDPATFFGPDFTSEMYLWFLQAIYPSERNRSTSPACTLADAAVQLDKRNIITVLLSLFPEHPLNESESSERTLLFSIMHFSLRNTDSAQSTVHSRQHRFVLDDYKWQLLRIAVPALNRIVHPLNKSLRKFDAEVFQEIGAYIASDLFLSGNRRPFLARVLWRRYTKDAVHCVASLMHREPRFHVLVPREKWATTSLFLNIAKLWQFSQPGKFILWCMPQAEFRPCYQGHIQLRPRDDFNHVNCFIIYILSQGFSRGVKEAYEAFRDQCGWDYIARHAYVHPKAIDGVTSYFTGLSEATKKENEKPDATFPSSYIDDLHQAKTIRSICATIVNSGVPPRPILNSLASIDPKHTNWLDILAELRSSGEFSIEKYDFRRRLSDDEVERLKKEMMHAVDILEKCLCCKRYINWTWPSWKPQQRDLEKGVLCGLG